MTHNIIILAPSTDEYLLDEIIDIRFPEYLKSINYNPIIIETSKKPIEEWIVDLQNANPILVWVDFYTLDDYLTVYSLIDGLGYKRSSNDITKLHFSNNKLLIRFFLQKYFSELNPECWSTNVSKLRCGTYIAKPINSAGSFNMKKIIITNESRLDLNFSDNFIFESFVIAKEYGCVFLDCNFIGSYIITIPENEIFDEIKKRNRTLYYESTILPNSVISILTQVIKKLDISGLARFDIKFDGKKVTVLELNSPATCDYGFLIDGDTTLIYKQLLKKYISENDLKHN